MVYSGALIGGGIIAAIILSPYLNILSLGDEVAASLGVNVQLCRFAALFCAALLAASAVCICGLVGFVGLIIPHGARLLARTTGSASNEHRILVPLAALLGAALVALCDILARVLFLPYEIPSGILLSCLGAPFFLFFLLRKHGGKF
ncbi:hypothetical protein FACS189494_11320 [Spirochaetia bacterium]|nr:hypothetical protein FACS189494_11320 [Spirochaetia bacterium]